jgi:hypothetical protein
MYKGAAEGLRRATGVHRIAPQAGYIADDRLPELEAMSLAELVDEKVRLNHELARYETEIGVAKRGRSRELISLCHGKASIEHRLSALNDRIKILRRICIDDCWRQAVREICPDDRAAIEVRQRELFDAAAVLPG